MLLLIDNYDSFTHNLAQYFQQLNQDVRVVRNDAITLAEVEALNPDHIVLSPGPGRPEQAGITLDVIAHCQGRIPLLGVCLGHQAIVQHFGGKVVHAKAVMHGKTSLITHDNSMLFRDLPSTMTVTRYHSLVAERDSLPRCLRITAETADGEIMGIAHESLPLYGVQFHPESILTEHGLALLKNFVEH